MKKGFCKGAEFDFCGGKANRILFQSMDLAMSDVAIEQYKGQYLHCQALHSTMSNIIPLPFKSSLSASYADASELAQAMQCLE